MALREGRFPARVVQTRLGKTSGGEELAIVVEVFDSLADRETGKNALGRITHYRYFTDRGFEYAVQTLVDFGWDPKERWQQVAELDKGDKSPLAGKECEAVLASEEHEGKKRLKVKWLNGPNRTFEPVKEAVDSDSLTTLGDRMKSWTPSSPAAAPVAAATGAEDDTPF